MRSPLPSKPHRRAIARVLAGATAALALFSAADAAAYAPSNNPTGDWTVLNGPVNAVARAGDGVYLGGRFRGLGRHAPGIAAFELDSAGADPDEFTGPQSRLDPLGTEEIKVTAITDAPDGGVYVAGVFAGAGGVDRPRLLRLGPSGALDTSFRPQVPDARIDDMDVADGLLYLAGGFTTVGGAPRGGGLAAVDAATGDVEAWNPAATGSVGQLAVGPGAVYVGGDFTSVRGQPRSNVAALSPTGAGALLAWNPDANSTVTALELALDGSTVYLGGRFTAVGGQPRSALAAVSAAGGGPLRDWNPAPRAPLPGNPAVRQIAVGPSGVYVAGAFTAIGSQTPKPARASLAAVDATSGEALAWDAKANKAPSDLAVHAGRVYLSWNDIFGYSGPNRPTLPTLNSDDPSVSPRRGEIRCGLAAVDASTGTATAWDPRVAKGDDVCDPAPDLSNRPGADLLSVAGGRVWAGGTFTVADIRKRSGLAALNASTGEPLAWAPRLPGVNPSGSDFVYDLAPSPSGSTIYVGGSFARVNDQTRRNAAAVRAAGAADAPGDLTAWNPAPDDVVRALALSPSGGLVYLGGDFLRAGAGARARLAVVGAATGNAGAWQPNADAPVLDLLVDPGTRRLLVGGRFSSFLHGSAATDDIPRTGVAAFDTATTPENPRTLPSWNAGLAAGAQVEALALRGSELIAGGTFAAPGGQANLAAFDLATAALAPWSPLISGRPNATGLVQTVAVDPADGTAYVTGNFTTVGDEPRSGAAAVGIDGAPTGWDPAPTDNFGSTIQPPPPPGGVVLLDDGRPLLTGAFRIVDGMPQAGFALFGPATAPSGGTPPSIAGTAAVNQLLTCVAGTFSGGRGTIKRAWLRNGTAIAEATASTYRVVSADTGSELRCRETVINAAGRAELISAPVAVARLRPELDSPPTVAGQHWVGGTARCTTGLWRNTPTSYRFRWFFDDGAEPVAGATAATFEVTAAEHGRRLACEVTAANEAGAALEPARSAAVTVTEAPPAPAGGPLITGDARVGSRLTCEPGPWERARGFSYQWLRDRVPLGEAVAPTYVATSRDLGRALTCLVTADNPGGTTSAESFAVVVRASERSTGSGRRANPEDDEPVSTSSSRRKIEIRDVRLRAGRTLAVTVAAPAAGRIGVTVVRNTGAKAITAKTRTTTVARGSRTVRRATGATVRVTLSSPARRLVARAGRRGLRVTVRVSFRPAKGSAISSDRTTRTLSTRASRR